MLQIQKGRRKRNLLPDKGMLAPEDISAVVLWLASEEARHITGYTLPVDAGFLRR